MKVRLTPAALSEPYLTTRIGIDNKTLFLDILLNKTVFVKIYFRTALKQ